MELIININDLVLRMCLFKRNFLLGHFFMFYVSKKCFFLFLRGSVEKYIDKGIDAPFLSVLIFGLIFMF